MAQPEAMVFDIGDVLVKWDPAPLYRRLIPDDAARAHFFAEIMPPEVNAGFDRGEPMPEGVERHAAKHPEHAHLIRAWWTSWPETIGPAIDGSVACLRALKAKGAPVYGLTNFASDTLAIAREMFPFLNEFDVCVVSAEVKANKPEPEIYAALEAAVPHAPETLFFTDDKPYNIAAAEARGWRGHHFTGADGLHDALIAAGLLTRAEIDAALGEMRA
ncbi:HAD-IA family hydrolase [Rubrimonas cliftonensis]|uniref:2-haloacid dehalogenase n=1 Tax=Rubrimonas cliftonensis TaxID=89524 RepID=A0A1H3VMW5_9RHOB|nr:HAD-IA family hydrolase [Rubrimonas cliftonensis]SDZ75458.1 2-haloacid dehalogenase [Rubrimonas cliftonensis]